MNWTNNIWKFLTNRLFIMLLCICLLFYLLTLKLFDLQIVNGESYQSDLRLTTVKTLEVSAPRGVIYDKFGRPLAKNESAFSIKIDPSVKIDTQKYDYNKMLRDFIHVLEQNDESYIDEFPITTTEPFEFLFSDNKSRETKWKEDMGLNDRKGEYVNYTAEETFLKLREMFKIPEEWTNREARKVLSLRSSIYMQRYRQYNSITIALNVKPETIAILGEENTKYPGIYIDVEPLREYPEGKYFSHIIGYIGSITNDEYEELKDEGYHMSDTIGVNGLERSLESDLRGENGTRTIEIDNLGRPTQTLDILEPEQGNKVFLTIDMDFQKKTYDILEDMLKTIIKNKLQGLSRDEAPITLPQVFASIVKSNNISLIELWNAKPGTTSHDVKEYLLSIDETANVSTSEERDEVSLLFREEIEAGRITSYQMLLILLEQDIITGDDEFRDSLINRKASPLQVVLEKIDSDELTPQIMNLDPCSGSIVVVDVTDGSVLASVSYPTYDNNQLVNNLNNEYYNKLNNDPSSPFLNRAFREGRAPGSTFKMLSAITGLENGVITPTTMIYDEYTFTKAGRPYANCNSHHGLINVVTALEASCNFFFQETMYRLGNSKTGNKEDSIRALNEVMTEFGLNSKTGVELGELADFRPADIPLISSPEYKKYEHLRWNEDATPTQYDWYDGDTRDTAIGQSYNNYTAATMAKYIATLASRGNRYQMHFVKSKESADGATKELFAPNLEHVVQLQDETWETVYKGMVAVTTGSRGLATRIFGDFPITVAGKTGTAEEIKTRNSHLSFGCFAPFEDPQVAVYVSLPFGDTKTTTNPTAQIAKEVLAEYFGLNAEPQSGSMNNTLIP